MARSVIDGSKSEVKLKSRNTIIEFDKLKLYFREPYEIDLPDTSGKIIIYQPVIYDIVKMGEKKFYGSLNSFVVNTTGCRLMLWELGIDWNEISDFDLFTMLYQTIDPDVSSMLFNGVNIQEFKICKKKIDEDSYKKILYDENLKIEIDEQVYLHISQFLKNIFNMFPEEKITSDPMLKKMYIEKDKKTAAIMSSKKDDSSSSSLLSLVSSCINHPGFKYNLEELKNVGVYQFYDSVKRLQIYENSIALLHGMYGGMISSKDIDQNATNFMREL